MKQRRPIQIMQSVIFALVLREMRTRFGSQRMGWFWMIFEPMAHMALLMFVFGYIRGREVPGMDYAVYLVSGLVPFFLMRNLSLRLMEAVHANKALFAYPNIKPFDTFVARTIVEFSLMACVFVILMGAMGLWLGYDVSIHHPLQWLAAVGTGVMFSFALGLVFCFIVEAMPNAKTFIRLLFMPLYFLSCVIIPVWSIPPQWMHYLLWNPFLHIVDNIRSSTFVHYPEVVGVSYTYPAAVALVTLFFGMALYRLRREELLAI